MLLGRKSEISPLCPERREFHECHGLLLPLLHQMCHHSLVLASLQTLCPRVGQDRTGVSPGQESGRGSCPGPKPSRETTGGSPGTCSHTRGTLGLFLAQEKQNTVPSRAASLGPSSCPALLVHSFLWQLPPSLPAPAGHHSLTPASTWLGGLQLTLETVVLRPTLSHVVLT